MKDHAVFNGEKFAVYDPRNITDTTADLRYHDGEAQNESWFTVSNLTSNGDRIGVQVHALVTPMAVSLNFAVVNETRNLYRSFEFVHQISDVKISNSGFDIEVDGFHFGGTSERIFAKIEFPGAEINLEARSTALPLRYNCVGYTDFLGAAQYLFSYPRMETKGSITIEKMNFPIEGITWFDRQYGELPNPDAQQSGEKDRVPENRYSQVQWIWFNPQLSNGVNISFGEIVLLAARKVTDFATILYPDGTYVSAQTDLVERFDYWESPVTGNRYPTRFVLKVPHCGATLEINVPFKEQEIVSKVGGVTKFEGMADITGVFDGEPITGLCYVELVGNWK
ncbi:hypothetical protein LUX29_19980 [Aureimonas altamirensis]|uniref:lipocalin family protein n=1 Tax=Aureimonas altamirensis TaxID=370622 RepID=UPI001E4FEE95|nr:lipocalin family protein [Aureimonas altamirensis]UHD45255.1 hypothetical protein LUX29_19980 [Aureimonas altamirensis]